MNSHAIGVEIGNDGRGERYTWPQQESVLKVGTALSLAYGIRSDHHRAHFEWAPGRKIDPAGPAKWNDYINMKWLMNRLRADILRNLLTPPVITPGEPEDDMKPAMFYVDTRMRGTFACVGGRWVSWPLGVPDGTDVPVYKGDHPWTRAQILHDQGPEGRRLWEDRMAI
jgi:hypothetical protein